jgi:hypothetical protein
LAEHTLQRRRDLGDDLRLLLGRHAVAVMRTFTEGMGWTLKRGGKGAWDRAGDVSAPESPKWWVV